MFAIGGGGFDPAAPGAIGGTTPAAITGTTITATTALLVGSQPGLRLLEDGTEGLIYGGVTPSTANYSFKVSANGLYPIINLPSTTGEFRIFVANSTTKFSQTGTAGAGPAITAGTATTDVNALSTTQTWNGGAVNFRGIRQVVTATASAAGSLDLSLERSTGQGTGVSMLSELTTIAAAATTDTTITMPAGALVLGVSVRVTTVIPTATTFTVGDSGSAARFSTAAVSVAATSTDAGTKAGAYYNASALAVRITPNGTPADNTGRVRVTIHYILVTPPTS